MTSDGGKPIVVGVDGSESSVRAVRWAAAEARRRQCGLRLVFGNVAPLINEGRPPMPVAMPQSFADAMRSQGEEWLDQAETAARTETPDLEIETMARTGAAAWVLVEGSKSAALVVVGSRGLGGFTGLVVGSVAVTLSSHAECPVAVVRGSDDAVGGDGPVIVGVDGSSGSEAAVQYAFEAARMRGVELHAVHAWHSLTSEEAVERHHVEGGWSVVQHDEERLLAEVLAGWGERYPDVVVRRSVPLDKPARALTEQADHAQLVVVGARGRGGFTGLLLGSTSQKLIQHSPCPVVVVR